MSGADPDGPGDLDPRDLDEVRRRVVDLYDRLQDDIVECRFAWGGEPRSGGYVVPPPAG